MMTLRCAARSSGCHFWVLRRSGLSERYARVNAFSMALKYSLAVTKCSLLLTGTPHSYYGNAGVVALIPLGIFFGSAGN